MPNCVCFVRGLRVEPGKLVCFFSVKCVSVPDNVLLK